MNERMHFILRGWWIRLGIFLHPALASEGLIIQKWGKIGRGGGEEGGRNWRKRDRTMISSTLFYVHRDCTDY